MAQSNRVSGEYAITELPLKRERLSETPKEHKVKAYTSLKLSKGQQSRVLRLPTYDDDTDLERAEQTEMSLPTSQSRS